MRNLTVSDSINLKGSKEFNHLRISNIDKFLSEYTNNLDYYSPPFRILSELENQIAFKNNPDACILIPYKPDGHIIFRLAEIKEESELRIVVFEYDGSIS